MARNSDLWTVVDGETTHVLETKWTVSRGRETYGYNVCTLYADGKKAARCNGGGYDMTGTVIGEWIEKNYQDRLKTLTPAHIYTQDVSGSYRRADGQEETQRSPENYGLTFELDSADNFVKASLDGACGQSCMLRLAERIGLKFTWVR
jgi:hypothetical protein